MTVSVEQAARNALQAYLQTQLTAQSVAITVFPGWPEGNVKLFAANARAMSILFAGDREELLFDPVPLGAPTVLSATQVSQVWEIASVTQPMQLDLWAQTDAARDDLMRRVDDLLRQGLGVTLGQANADPFRHSIILPLNDATDGWTGNCNFYFDRLRRADTPDAIQRAEYRAYAIGNAYTVLTETATSSRMARITFKQKLHESKVAPSGLLFDPVTIVYRNAASNIVASHTTGP